MAEPHSDPGSKASPRPKRPRRRRKPGLSPGTLVHVGERKADRVKVTLFDYDSERLEEREVALEEVGQLGPYRERPSMTWINVDGLHEVAVLAKIGEQFGIHSLVLEDILHTDQRPKVEYHEGHVFVVLKMLQYNANEGKVDAEQVSLILARDYVLSFQEKSGDVFDPIRENLRTGRGKVRHMGADYLFYRLIDTIVDNYFATLEKIGEEIEGLEEVILDEPTEEAMRALHRIRRETIVLRKAAWPMREAVSSLYREGNPLITPATRPYLRDVYDHAIQVIDTIESHRDLISGIRDTYLTELSNRTNEVMKVLTIVATLFIPLTFIAGVYGMNFNPDTGPFSMPELAWEWGYPVTLGAMAVIAAIMVAYFRRNEWI